MWPIPSLIVFRRLDGAFRPRSAKGEKRPAISNAVTSATITIGAIDEINAENSASAERMGSLTWAAAKSTHKQKERTISVLTRTASIFHFLPVHACYL